MDSLGHGGLPVRVVGGVEVHEAMTAAERFGHLRPDVVLQVGDDDGCPGGCQGAGHPFAEALRPSGYQGLTAGEVEISHRRSPQIGLVVVMVTT